MRPASPEQYDPTGPIEATDNRRIDALEQRGHDLLLEYSENPPAFRSAWAEASHNSNAELTLHGRNQQNVDRLTKAMLFGSLTPVETAEWYLRLGASADMSDAKAYLVHAAELITTGLEEGKPGSARVAGRDLSEGSTRTIAGNMLMEAARSSEGVERSYLMKQANAVMEPVHTPEAQQFRIEAVVDLAMQSPDIELHTKAHELQRRQFIKIAKRLEQTQGNDNRGELIGSLVEMAALISLQAAAQAEGGTVRRASLREDQPIDGHTVASGFIRHSKDMVVEIDDEIIDVQIKTRRRLESAEDTAIRSGSYAEPVILAISQCHAREILRNWHDAEFLQEIGSGYLEDLRRLKQDKNGTAEYSQAA